MRAPTRDGIAHSRAFKCRFPEAGRGSWAAAPKWAQAIIGSEEDLVWPPKGKQPSSFVKASP